MIEQADAILHRTRLAVIGSEIKSCNPCLSDGRGAHGAGFKRDIESAVHQPTPTQRPGRGPDGQDLGMRCRVTPGLDCVGCRGNDPSIGGGNHGTNRNLTGLTGAPGKIKCHCHDMGQLALSS